MFLLRISNHFSIRLFTYKKSSKFEIQFTKVNTTQASYARIQQAMQLYPQGKALKQSKLLSPFSKQRELSDYSWGKEERLEDRSRGYF